jgi:predicted transcriptional regulator
MIKVLETAVEKVKRMTPEQQKRAASILEDFAENPDDLQELSPDEEAFLAEGLAQLERGEYASEAEVRAAFDRYKT